MNFLKIQNKEVLLQSFWAFFVKVLGALTAFGMSIVLARKLGAHQSGYFFLGLTLISFFGAVSRCGFDNVVLRYTAAAKSVSDWTTIRRVFFLGAGGTLIFSAFVAGFLWLGSGYWASAFFGKPDLAPVLAAIAPSVVSFALLWLVAQSLQGMGRASSAILAMNVVSNITLIVSASLFEVRLGAQAAFAYSVGSLLVLAGFLIFWYSRVTRDISQQTYEISLASMMASAWPLWIVLLMSQLIQWTGQFVGGAYLPPEEIAQLAVAQRTAMLVSFILTAVNMVVAPRFAALHASGNMEALQSMALTAVRLMAVGATPVVAVMFVFPDFLMGLFGEGFSGGTVLLQVLAVGQFVNVLTGSVGYLLSMSGHERDLRNTLLVVAPVSVVVTFILVPIYGALGAALSTALAVGAQNLLAVYWVKRRLGFNTLAVWRFKSV
ncbi:oligosaccharide flippase family protein [Marinobacter sp. F4216]|uniref:oligosaccharide flippase family protein n=1 Tax=Marinobacter sp. F4216 TaxID=2874281 RepID=UPI001CBE5BD8|nr:oligosaccharide flippase family protein [Marinobacter sp. F4216]MBZ2168425.1 oligosaccharide flippase family protein [Marinobacter sp. F4216]